MMPNIDPRTLKNMMAKMGMQSEEINAQRVTIECADRDIVISSPTITKIVMQGATSYQISGDVSESPKDSKIEITDTDIKFVEEKTGIHDIEAIKDAINKADGSIADAIIALSG
ncbi:MAG: nascent polypeptide-associated complex protein [Candidatus Marsarchaeota archaeon]|jgi:alpha-NAC-related protein|nr:nascent polypeptide-associated complex protein [Candidatus Marsarchaeota archaeon]